MSDHPDVDALSASLDEESPEGFAAHLQSCPGCRGRLAELQRARDAVAQPVPPLAVDLRERAIAQALAGGAAPVPVRTPRTPRLQWWLGGAAAAVVALVLGAVVLVSPGRQSSDQTALNAGPATEREAASDASGQGVTPAAGSVAGASGMTDLGDVPSVEALRSRIGLPLTAAAAGSAESRTTAGSGSAAAAPVPPASQSGAMAQSGPMSAQVGTRVCEEAARTARPQLGVVVYAANLRYQGTPAVVLGFAATATAPPATLLVLAPEQGCRLLAETPS